MKHEPFIATPNSTIKLKNFDPKYSGSLDKKTAQLELQAGVERLAAYQNVLYAQNSYALLIIFQAMDAAGKDSTIKHVMSGVNPQGCQVYSFKKPSDEELDHDYLWRSARALPERGRIGIFNRSYYEEVLVVRVHPELLALQKLPPALNHKKIWDQRFEEINNFEKYLVNNGIIVLKFFLHVSKEEQKKRFLDRINQPEKNWKFSASDAKERAAWDEYMSAYEAVFSHTSTPWSPWYIIPADQKWFTRLAVSDIICSKLKSLNLTYPTMTQQHQQDLLEAKKVLEQEP
ncbi:MAG: polyphosphate kinase 2 family protein [Myxacorys californica WJT36-NPBG1]|jgi:PPK2 family polyphosphate:nucleotide phosphotransferase|nr:polyphosphate kinase 2 family protein [Myxacorys californica WJT36-NPBG1]